MAQYPMGNARCGCPRYLIEPPLSPNGGESYGCGHTAECKQKSSAVQPAAKKKAKKSSVSQEV